MTEHDRLDTAIEARIVDMGISYVELAERAGISDVSLRNFRKGRGNLRARNQRKLENALGWEPGSIATVLDGGAPLLAGEAYEPEVLSVEEIRLMIAEIEDEIANLVVKHERNRAYLVEHLEKRLAELRTRLAPLQ